MRRTTIVLPDDLHEQLRTEAFDRRMSMAELIRFRLRRERRPARSSRWKSDPLRKVEGIGSDGKLAEGIDAALYGI